MITHNSIYELNQYALRLTRNIMDAEDLVQDVLVKAWQYRHNFIGDGKAEMGWMRRIMYNTFITKRTKRQILYTNDEIDSYINHFDVPAVLYEERYSDDVQKYVNRISPKNLTALELSFDHTYTEISVILDIPIGSVMSRIHRAKKQFKNESTAS